MPFVGSDFQLSASPNEWRIVSLVPSITELLCHLGLQKNIVGCTKFCVHPIGFKQTVKIIGGTKNVRVADVVNLNPTLVIANKEENQKDDIVTLAEQVPVHLSDINTIADFKEFLTTLGSMFNIQNACESMRTKLDSLLELAPNFNGKKVLYFIWKDPYMAAGTHTYINDVLKSAGLVNCLDDERYPEINLNEINHYKPDVIFLSSEPYPFKEKDVEELKQRFLCDVYLVDGELFSWYSNRILHLPAHLNAIAHY